MSARDKTGLGYGTQLNKMSNNFETNSEISLSVFDVRLSDEENTPANDSFSKVYRFHVVPPPITGNFLTPRVDISFAGLDEYAIRNKIIKSKTTDLHTKTSETIDDEDDVSEVQTVSPVKTNEIPTVKTRVDKIDCNFHNKQSQEPKLKTMVNTGPRVGVLTRTGLITPVKKNEKRAVHKVGTARSVSTDRPVSTARPVSTVRPFAPKIAQTSGAIRPIYLRIDNVRPRGSYSPIKRSFYTKLAFRAKDLKQDVKTFRVQNMTTARTRAVVNYGKGKMDTELKKLRWVWRPKRNYLDHVSKDSGSFILKKGNPEILLQDHAVVDSGCSRHMTGNKAYLSDYEDYNGGFVAFGSDPKKGKIMGKGKIKTANLDFDDVYFVDELNFKLLDESQVVLRAPRKDDVYSLDLKNTVPSGGINAKAKDDVSKQVMKRKRGELHLKSKAAHGPILMGHFVSTDRSSVSTANTPYVSAARTSIDAFDTLPNDGIFNGANDDDEDVGTVADFNNMDNTIAVGLIPTLRSFVDPAHPNKVYKVIKALYGLHQAFFFPPELEYEDTCFFSNGKMVSEEDSRWFNGVNFTFLLGHQVKQQPDGIFISQDKSYDWLLIFCILVDYLFEVDDYSDSDSWRGRLDKNQQQQTIVANSTTKAEYVAAANCCGQVLWIQNQMMDYGFNFMNTKIHIDNESTISVIKNHVAHSRTKHIKIRFHFIRDCYEKRLIEVIKIYTDFNVADLLTKGFDVIRFNLLVVSIGLLNL
ncbi:hypothetical protein Tco_0839007 [Tanacetum coccineum]|uniref:Retrovirus-related Pol polyprotein from transposon TNT 1-94-like beta-barrel domain-containing protein n=1 Tax=Tanacetum coccineum TaxID=301880 RepID=A0ABQ5APE6_9ASTR